MREHGEKRRLQQAGGSPKGGPRCVITAFTASRRDPPSLVVPEPVCYRAPIAAGARRVTLLKAAPSVVHTGLGSRWGDNSSVITISYGKASQREA
jgi:hypothetical protein